MDGFVGKCGFMCLDGWDIGLCNVDVWLRLSVFLFRNVRGGDVYLVFV